MKHVVSSSLFNFCLVTVLENVGFGRASLAGPCPYWDYMQWTHICHETFILYWQRFATHPRNISGYDYQIFTSLMVLMKYFQLKVWLSTVIYLESNENQSGTWGIQKRTAMFQYFEHPLLYRTGSSFSCCLPNKYNFFLGGGGWKLIKGCYRHFINILQEWQTSL